MASEHGPSFSSRPAVQIDLNAIKDNYLALQKKVGTVKIAASVKADAYGLGAERVGKALYGAGCRNFLVTTAGEGKILRAAIGDNSSIYVLNGPSPRDLTLFFGSRLKPVINSLIQARLWADAIKTAKAAPYSAIHIDTGMNRLGFSEAEFEELCKNRPLRDGINHEYIMSHLACGPDASHPMNAQQLSKFKRLSGRLPIGPMSMANTAGIYLGKKYHFQMVRPGIGLYGGQATTDAGQEVSKPVVSLMAPVLQIREIKKGDTLGYNAAYIAPKDMTIATVGAGYADGIPVATSGVTNGPSSHATLLRQRVPIVGRVSMDLTMLDISHIKPPRMGDWAVFRGENLAIDAKAAGTIDYELLTRIGQRCRRIYL
ncbi:MAG: alanine racemase [Alphaproteobacteria bacterium]